MIDWKIDGDGHCFNVLSIKCSAFVWHSGGQARQRDGRTTTQGVCWRREVRTGHLLRSYNCSRYICVGELIRESDSVKVAQTDCGLPMK